MSNTRSFSDWRSRFPRCHKDLHIIDPNNYGSVRLDLLEAYFNAFKVEIDDLLKTDKILSNINTIISSRIIECKKDIYNQPVIFNKINIYEIFFKEMNDSVVDWGTDLFDNVELSMEESIKYNTIFIKLIRNIFSYHIDVNILSKCAGCYCRCRRCGLDDFCVCGTDEFRQYGYKIYMNNKEFHLESMFEGAFQ